MKCFLQCQHCYPSHSAVTRACRVACGVSVPVRGVCDRTVITIGVVVTEKREAVGEGVGGVKCEM